MHCLIPWLDTYFRNRGCRMQRLQYYPTRNLTHLDSTFDTTQSAWNKVRVCNADADGSLVQDSPDW
jgi:hypothetical protein